jgi:hypothetical protein
MQQFPTCFAVHRHSYMLETSLLTPTLDTGVFVAKHIVHTAWHRERQLSDELLVCFRPSDNPMPEATLHPFCDIFNSEVG